MAAVDVEQLAGHLEECEVCCARLKEIEDGTLVQAIRAGVKLVRGHSRPVVFDLIQRLNRLGGQPSARDSDTLPSRAEIAQPLEDVAGELRACLAPPAGPGELGTLGPYRVLTVLGTGGMGIVLKAHDVALGRPVALKVMRPALTGSASARQRFVREAQATAAIKHDHVVTIHQVGEDRGVAYLAMEFLEGESLQQRLQPGKPLPIPEAVRIGRQVAEGLAAAHERGVIHRDITPGNIWLESVVRSPSSVAHEDNVAPPTDDGPRTTDYRVKILDFGLARAMEQQEKMTRPGTLLGSPAYMAPEQAAGRPVDGRADLFSLGCVLYRLCTGVSPFQRPDTMATIRALEMVHPQWPAAVNPAVPPALSELVMRLLAKEPDERPASAHEVVLSLRGLECANQASKRAASLPGLRWSVSAIALLLAVGLPVFLGLQLLSSRVPQPAPAIAVGTPFPPKEVEKVFGNPAWHHWGGGVDLRFDAQGKMLAASTSGRAFWVWDVESGKVIQTFPFPPGTRRVYHDAGWQTLALLTGEQDNWDWTLYDLASGKPKCKLRGHGGVLDRGHVSTRGDLFVASAGASLLVWDAITGRELAEHQLPVRGAVTCVSGDGRLLVASEDSPEGKPTNRLRLLDTLTGKERGILTLAKAPTRVYGPVLSPDARLVATPTRGREVEVCDTEKEHTLFSVPTDLANPIWFSPDGKHLVTLVGKQLKIWDAATGKERTALSTTGNGSPTFSVDDRFAFADASGMVRLWHLKTGKELTPAVPEWNITRFTNLSRDGRTLIRGFGPILEPANQVTSLDLTSGKEEVLLTRRKTPIYAAALAPNGKVVASRGDNTPGTGLAISADGRMLAIHAPDGVLVLRSQEQEKDVVLKGHVFSSPPVVAFSANRKTLAAAGRPDHVIRVWDAITGTETNKLPGGDDGIRVLALTPDNRLVSAHDSGTIRLWDVATGKELPSFKGHDFDVTAVVFSSDGKHLFSAGDDGLLIQWDVAARKALKTWSFPGPIKGLGLTPESRLVTANGNGTVFVMELKK